MFKYAIFILTHGRPDNVVTLETLRRQGYTQDNIFFIVDDEDKTRFEYVEKYGDKVIFFSKKEIVKEFDEGDNFNKRNTVIYARNACFKIARDLGYRYFIQFDDDYTRFEYVFDDEEKFCHHVTYKLDEVFQSIFEYYKKINALSIAIAQGGDYLGGEDGGFAYSINRRRKAMNSFFCDTERSFMFVGKINEDVNTYTSLGNRGNLFLTIPNISLIQKPTQSNKGGMSDIYLDGGTYIKSFYSVMMSPSFVKISEMGSHHKRLHHKVIWKYGVPKIIREEHKK